MRRSSDTSLVGIAFLSFIAIGFTAGISGVAWPSMRDSFGVSLDAIGALFFTSTAGALLISLNSGPIISKIGLGTLLLIGCIVGGMGFLGYALAPTWSLMIASSFLAAIGTSGVIAALNTYFAISRSAKLMNWLQACFGLGATLSPMLISRLIELGYSWRWGFAFVCFSLWGLAVGFGFTRETWQSAAAAPGASADQPRQTRSSETLKLAPVWLSLLLFFTFTGLEGSAGQWPFTLFTEARSIDPRTAGLWVSVFWAAVTVGRVFFGIITNKVGIVPLIRMTMIGVSCGAVLIWWNINDTLSFLGLALIGFSASPVFPVLTSDTPRRLGSQHAANAIGFQLASARLGLAAIPALAGVLAAAYGLEIIGPFLVTVSVTQFLLHEATLSEKMRPKNTPKAQDPL